MIYNDQQFEALAKFEDAFVSAIESNYASNPPGTEQLKLIRATYIAATGARNVPEDYGCSTCVIRLLRKAGRLWFEDRDARIAAAKDAEAAKLSAQQALDESAAAPSLDIKVDGDTVEVSTTYLAPEQAAAAASGPATDPSTPAPGTNTTKTVKAAQTAPKSKTPKK